MSSLARTTDVGRGLAVALVIAGVLTLVGSATPAGAVTPCGEQVVEDWRDNRRIDRLYDLHCYEEGIDAIPLELRDYTDAEDVIRQAYLSRGGARRPPEPPRSEQDDQPPPPEVVPTINTSGTTDVPFQVLVLGALALVLLSAGALGYVDYEPGDGLGRMILQLD